MAAAVFAAAAPLAAAAVAVAPHDDAAAATVVVVAAMATVAPAAAAMLLAVATAELLLSPLLQRRFNCSCEFGLCAVSSLLCPLHDALLRWELFFRFPDRCHIRWLLTEVKGDGVTSSTALEVRPNTPFQEFHGTKGMPIFLSTIFQGMKLG